MKKQKKETENQNTDILLQNDANKPVLENTECEPNEPCVSVTLRVEQIGSASPFAMEMKINAKQKDVTIPGLARKAAYSLADGLHKVATEAMSARVKYGHYLTAFRPKSVFRIYIAIDGTMAFQAIKTKGLDAIRIVQNGQLIPRSLMVQKMTLLAEQSKAADTMAHIFAAEIAIDEAIQVEQPLIPSDMVINPELSNTGV